MKTLRCSCIMQIKTFKQFIVLFSQVFFEYKLNSQKGFTLNIKIKNDKSSKLCFGWNENINLKVQVPS